jgi:hypothetical protein
MPLTLGLSSTSVSVYRYYTPVSQQISEYYFKSQIMLSLILKWAIAAMIELITWPLYYYTFVPSTVQP